MSTMMSDDFILEVPDVDSFKMWQGLVGPYFTPYIDEYGILSWTNTGGLVNPAAVSVIGPPGKGLEVKGVVATYADLPQNPQDGDTYLVGTEAPYDGYMWIDGEWIEIGDVSKGEDGRGIVSITKTGTSGLVDEYTILYTEGSPTVYYVTNGKDGVDGQDGQDGQDGVGVPTGGTTGQVLAKASGTDYDTEWVNQSAGVDPATASPLMDGTAAVGTSTKYAREDHVHPTDTSRATKADFTSFTITLASASWSSNAQTVSDAKFIASGYSYIVSPASASFADYCAAQIYADDVTTTGQMTFHCTDVPSSNLTVNIVRVVAS